jgi:plasmid segregation protein ParM
VVGTPDRPHFSLDNRHGIILTTPARVAVGEEAIEQSRFLERREAQGWIRTEEWYYLALAALTELTPATATLTIVTGLPVRHYGDREEVAARLEGEHAAGREGRRAQTLAVEKVTVVPEPYGTIFDAMWDGSGRVADADLATGNVGVIDIGGKTTNLLSVRRIREIGRETDSLDVGGWDVMRAVRVYLDRVCPGLALRDHEVMQAIIQRWTWYDGRRVELAEVTAEAAANLARQIAAAAATLWSNGKGLSHTLITGGGAHLLGPLLRRHLTLPNQRIVPEPVLANARGFWKYARYQRARA